MSHHASPLFAAALILLLAELASAADPARPVAAAIGQQIFFDTSLSNPKGQGCVSCHQPEAAFADPRRISPGAVKGREGRRNSPSLMYAALIPPRAYEEVVLPDGEEIYAWEGGMFLDGRARDLFEQVRQPFFDRNEMNLENEAALAERLRRSDYADKMRAWVGQDNWANDERLSYHAYRALAEFLKDPIFRPFDSRFDDYRKGNPDALTASERRGMEVYRGAGGCNDCHPLSPRSWDQPLLSDFGYDNLGVPSRGSRDPGLEATTGLPEHYGQFRAPSLRNIALTAPYMHNGAIKTLREVVEFYNKREIEASRWGPTDYPATVNRDDLGKLELTEAQVEDLVHFLESFTDRTLLSDRDAQGLPLSDSKTPPAESIRLRFPDWTHRLHPAFPGVPDQPEQAN